MKVERVIVENVHGKEHQDQVEVIRKWNCVTLPTPVHFVDETFDRNDHKLQSEGIVGEKSRPPRKTMVLMF